MGLNSGKCWGKQNIAKELSFSSSPECIFYHLWILFSVCCVCVCGGGWSWWDKPSMNIKRCRCSATKFVHVMPVKANYTSNIHQNTHHYRDTTSYNIADRLGPKFQAVSSIHMNITICSKEDFSDQDMRYQSSVAQWKFLAEARYNKQWWYVNTMKQCTMDSTVSEWVLNWDVVWC